MSLFFRIRWPYYKYARQNQ